MDSCVVTVGELASTGAFMPLWMSVLAVLLLGLGVVALWRVRRRVAVAAGVIVLLGALVVAPSPAAMAAAPVVDYSSGCSLIAVDQVELHEAATELLPGDRVAAMSLQVVNRTAAPVQLSLAAALDAVFPLDAAVLLSVDGPLGPLVAGGSSLWTVYVELPLAADNSVQLLAAPLTLTIRATQ